MKSVTFIVSVLASPSRHSMIIIQRFILINHFILIVNNVFICFEHVFNSTDDFHMYIWSHHFYFISIISQQDLEILKRNHDHLSTWCRPNQSCRRNQHRQCQPCWTPKLKAVASWIRPKLISQAVHGKSTLERHNHLRRISQKHWRDGGDWQQPNHSHYKLRVQRPLILDHNMIHQPP